MNLPYNLPGRRPDSYVRLAHLGKGPDAGVARLRARIEQTISVFFCVSDDLVHQKHGRIKQLPPVAKIGRS